MLSHLAGSSELSDVPEDAYSDCDEAIREDFHDDASVKFGIENHPRDGIENPFIAEKVSAKPSEYSAETPCDGPVLPPATETLAKEIIQELCKSDESSELSDIHTCDSTIESVIMEASVQESANEPSPEKRNIDGNDVVEKQFVTEIPLEALQKECADGTLESDSLSLSAASECMGNQTESVNDCDEDFKKDETCNLDVVQEKMQDPNKDSSGLTSVPSGFSESTNESLELSRMPDDEISEIVAEVISQPTAPPDNAAQKTPIEPLTTRNSTVTILNSQSDLDTDEGSDFLLEISPKKVPPSVWKEVGNNISDEISEDELLRTDDIAENKDQDESDPNESREISQISSDELVRPQTVAMDQETTSPNRHTPQKLHLLSGLRPNTALQSPIIISDSEAGQSPGSSKHDSPNISIQAKGRPGRLIPNLPPVKGTPRFHPYSPIKKDARGIPIVLPKRLSVSKNK